MLSYVPLIIFVVTTNALSQTLLKQGMTQIGEFDLNSANTASTVVRILFDPWVVGGLAVMAISMAAHLYVLSRVPLTFAFPFIALSYIVVLAIGYFIFNEALNQYHYLGTLLIMGGIICIGLAGERADALQQNLEISQKDATHDA